jgi:hypothetical protein
MMWMPAASISSSDRKVSTTGRSERECVGDLRARSVAGPLLDWVVVTLSGKRCAVLDSGECMPRLNVPSSSMVFCCA